MWPGRPALPASTSRRLGPHHRPTGTGRRPDRGCPARRVPAGGAGGRRRAATRQSTPTTSAPASAISPSSSPVSTPKWMRGTPRSATRRQHLGRVRAARSAGSRAGSACRPTSRTAAPPARRPATCERSEAMARSARRSSSACHSGSSPYISALVSAVRPRRAALDEVAGDGERRAGEADQRHGRARSARMRDGLEDVRRVELGLEGAEAVEVGGASGTAGSTTGPVPGRDVDAEADGGHGHDDVGVEDGGVDAVAAHRLQRDLGRQLRAWRWRRGSLPSPRMARYSGSERPAWRMNHTGVRRRGLAAAGGEERVVGGARSPGQTYPSTQRRPPWPAARPADRSAWRVTAVHPGAVHGLDGQAHDGEVVGSGLDDERPGRRPRCAGVQLSLQQLVVPHQRDAVDVRSGQVGADRHRRHDDDGVEPDAGAEHVGVGRGVGAAVHVALAVDLDRARRSRGSPRTPRPPCRRRAPAWRRARTPRGRPSSRRSAHSHRGGRRPAPDRLVDGTDPVADDRRGLGAGRRAHGHQVAGPEAPRLQHRPGQALGRRGTGPSPRPPADVEGPDRPGRVGDDPRALRRQRLVEHARREVGRRQAGSEERADAAAGRGARRPPRPSARPSRARASARSVPAW